MRITIITNYWHFPSEKDSSRFASLARIMTERGHEVTVLSSTFHHASKSQRRESIVDEVRGHRIILVPEPGYSRNISTTRLRSHAIFARNIASKLAELSPPDLIYCAFPPVSVARAAKRFAIDRGVKFVIDVQDLWPEAFAMAVGDSPVARLALRPMKRSADRIFRSADGVVAVSATYAGRVARAVGSKPTCVAYLGIDLDRFDGVRGDGPLTKAPGEIWLTYAGSLGNSYDLTTVIDAMEKVQVEWPGSIRFVVMGKGHREAEFRLQAERKRIQCTFLGNLNYEDVVRVLRSSDLAINSIIARSKASIINKHGDYLAAGLPIVNNQTSPEVEKLLREEQAGITCVPESPEAYAEAILRVLNDPVERSLMAVNARRLAEERFDRRKTYQRIVDLLEQV